MSDNFNNSYYTRPRTSPMIGKAIGDALTNFLAQRQEAQKMNMLQQELAWKNPNRPISPNELERMNREAYLKGLSNQLAYSQIGKAPSYQDWINQGSQPMTPFPVAVPVPVAQPMQTNQQGTQASDFQAKINALIEELYQARRAKGTSNA